MAGAERVRVAHASPVVAVGLVASAAAGGEAAVGGVTGARGGAAGLRAVRRRHGLVGRPWRQAQEVGELQVALVQQASLVVDSVALSFGYEVEELCGHAPCHVHTQKHTDI